MVRVKARVRVRVRVRARVSVRLWSMPTSSDSMSSCMPVCCQGSSQKEPMYTRAALVGLIRTGLGRVWWDGVGWAGQWFEDGRAGTRWTGTVDWGRWDRVGWAEAGAEAEAEAEARAGLRRG